MSQFTICPHFLINYPDTDPKTIEREIIKPLLECLVAAQKMGVTLVLSKEILTHFINSYPWNLMQDPNWCGYIRTWNETITQYIAKAKIVAVESSPATNNENCSKLQITITDMFARFLAIFGRSLLPRNKHEEGIFIGSDCHYPEHLELFHLFSTVEKLCEVKHPWLRVYGKPLPFEGDFPFIPPNNWRNFPSPIRGSNHGYVDNQGNEWGWDRLHNNHWDVQHSDRLNDYTNVTPTGNVLS